MVFEHDLDGFGYSETVWNWGIACSASGVSFLWYGLDIGKFFPASASKLGKSRSVILMVFVRKNSAGIERIKLFSGGSC